MLRIAITFLASLSLLFAVACGDSSEPHGSYTVKVEITPSPATAGVATEFEVEVLEGTKEVTPKEVHIKATKAGATTPIEITAAPDDHHFKATHTFADAATYTIEVEAHVDGGDGHDEEVTTTVQLVVQ